MPLPEPREHVLERQRGGGKIAAIGLIFVLAGIGIMVFGFIPAEVRNGDDFPPIIAIPFGLVFVAAGVAVAFGREGLVVDRKEGTAIKWWGLLKPMRQKTYSIDAFDHVTLASETRRSGKQTYTVYPVRLAGTGKESVTLSEERTPIAANRDAETLAKFLDFRIEDSASGETRIRDARSLDQSLKQRFETGSERNMIPETPSGLKSRIEYDSYGLKVEIPPPGFRPSLLVPMLVVIAFPIIFLSVFAPSVFGQRKGDSGDALIMGIFGFGFIAIPLLVTFRLLARACFVRQSVAASDQGIEVEKGWLRPKRTAIAADELEDLFITKRDSRSVDRGRTLRKTAAGPVAIVAQSDDQIVEFGQGLPPRELEYVLALAKAVLVTDR